MSCGATNCTRPAPHVGPCNGFPRKVEGDYWCYEHESAPERCTAVLSPTEDERIFGCIKLAGHEGDHINGRWEQWRQRPKRSITGPPKPIDTTRINRVVELQAEVERLTTENRRLRAALAAGGITRLSE